MATILTPLGFLPSQVKVGAWVFTQLVLSAGPAVKKMLQDPGGTISRLGDLVVWQGEQGRQVIATLEQITESQNRVLQVVQGIEQTQIGIAGTLGTLTALSMTTLGVASLTAGFMSWRMNALHNRLGAIGAHINDIQAILNAQQQAHIETSLDFLGKYEQSSSGNDLHKAQCEATFATNLYRNLVLREMSTQRRLLALNQCGRYYMLALTVQVHSLILSNELKQAEQQLKKEVPTLKELAKTTFEEVMGKSPEAYLDPALQDDRVTLDLLTEIYKLAHLVGAVDGKDFHDTGAVFEHFRQKIYGGSGMFGAIRRSRVNPLYRRHIATLLNNLRYLLACLEDVSRVQSLQLRIFETLAGRLSLQDLERAVASARDQAPASAEGGIPVIALALA